MKRPVAHQDHAADQVADGITRSKGQRNAAHPKPRNDTLVGHASDVCDSDDPRSHNDDLEHPRDQRNGDFVYQATCALGSALKAASGQFDDGKQQPTKCCRCGRGKRNGHSTKDCLGQARPSERKNDKARAYQKCCRFAQPSGCTDAQAAFSSAQTSAEQKRRALSSQSAKDDSK